MKNRYGIIAPCIQHRFRVFVYPIGERVEVSIPLMQQVVSIRYDLLERKAKLIVRDDIEGEASHYIAKLLGTSRSIELAVDAFGHCDEHLQRKIFEGAKIIGHTSGFDYAANEVVTHELTISFDYLRFEMPVAPKPEPKPTSLGDPLL